MRKKIKHVKTRKQRRKEERKGKKALKHQVYLARKKHQFKPGCKSRHEFESDNSIKSRKQYDENKEVKKKGNELVKKKKPLGEDFENLKKEFKKVRTERLKEDNLLEERNIKKLEKQLKLKKRKTKSVPKTFANDGLDYLLEVCETENLKNIVENERISDFDSDIEEDVQSSNSNKNIEEKIEDESLSNDVEEDEDLSNESDEEEDNGSVVGEENEEDETTDDDQISKCEKEKESKNDTWEDIYGRTRDKDGNIIQTYVPPHMKKITPTNVDSEKITRLKRQLKGLLNRLAESNMGSIATQIEQLYMTNSRNDMNVTLGQMLTDALVTYTLTPERLIMEHCMLITLLHCNVDTEIGAYFLQLITNKFNELLSGKLCIEDKNINNLLLILSYLYFFKVFHCILIYDLLSELMKSLEEKRVELILTVLKTVGFNLRKDDPVALKTFVLSIQSKSNEFLKNESSSRLKFMLDILMAIKNNNMSKIPNYDPEHGEHLKKMLKTLIRKGNVVSELKISFQDLLNAQEHGRWWVVGSAWSGAAPGKHEPTDKKLNENTFSQKLLDLARKQRMNSDDRRNIFCILMSSEDYLDAFEKLIRIGLKGQSERDIMNVIIHCCLREKTFNLYYVYLAGKFSSFNRKYQMMLQYAIWDKIKQLDTLPGEQVNSLAQFISCLVLAKDLPLSVLKVVEFTELNKSTVKFMRQVLLNILLDDNEEKITDVFERISKSKELKMFRQSIRLFIYHFILKKNKLSEDKLLQLRKVTDVVDKVLSYTDYRTIF